MFFWKTTGQCNAPELRVGLVVVAGNITCARLIYKRLLLPFQDFLNRNL